MANGPQKPEHGGNFFMIPRRLVDSVAWRHLSFRAQSILLVFLFHHNGFNNGQIGLGIHQMGRMTGNQNHGANAKAVAELIEKGFIECVSDADRHHAKVREYRITFIPTGSGKTSRPATHEYRDWRPPDGHKRKFGGARTATKGAHSVAETAVGQKFSSATAASSSMEIGASPAGRSVAVIAPLIGNQSPDLPGASHAESSSLPESSATVDLDVLRRWVGGVVDRLGYGGQKTLSEASGVPQPVLCKFKNGKRLPTRYAMNLQSACGRIWPFRDWLTESVAGQR